MASISSVDRQEIIQATLLKAFEKLAKKGAIPAAKASALRMELLDARAALLSVEVKKLEGLQDELKKLASERERLVAATTRK